MTGAALSLGEIEALGQKAARGAGLDWGLAEEAGWAARMLSASGLPGPELLALALAGGPGAAPRVAPGAWRGDGPLCPVRTGAALADFAGLPAGLSDDGMRIDTVRTPALLLPFVVLAAARIGRPLALDWGTGQGLAGGGTLSAAGDVMAPVAAVTLALAARGPETGGQPPRCAVAPEPRAALEALALDTTVPPSDTSRADAGAGGDDND